VLLGFLTIAFKCPFRRVRRVISISGAAKKTFSPVGKVRRGMKRHSVKVLLNEGNSE
jgi:hypothetical protein